MWKNRFGCFDGKVCHTPKEAGKVILATACLPNFAVSRGDMWVENGHVRHVEEHDINDDYVYSDGDTENLKSGKEKQQEIGDNFFTD